MAKGITRERLYQAKEAWHKNRARLPYLTKIRIWVSMQKTASLMRRAKEKNSLKALRKPMERRVGQGIPAPAASSERNL